MHQRMGEGEAGISVEYGSMTNTLLLFETVILGGVATALLLLVNAVRYSD